jgi:hypothetical protein
MGDDSEVERALLAIEARFAGVAAARDGRGSAAARDHVIERLRRELAEPPVEAEFSRLQPSVQYLLLMLARRYGVTAYRRKGQRKSTVLLALPEAFAHEVFEPAVKNMSKVLEAHLHEVAKRVVDAAFDSVAKSDIRLPQWALDE